MRPLAGILSGIALLALAAGCNTNGCMQNRNSVPLAGCYSSATGQAIAVDSVEIRGLGMPDDDPLWPAGKRLTQVYLPMRSTQPSTTWILSYRWKDLDYPELNDTIVFDYDSTPFFDSEECGVIFKYDIRKMSHTRHLLDSVVIADSLITNVDTERIKIYFRTNDGADE